MFPDIHDFLTTSIYKAKAHAERHSVASQTQSNMVLSEYAKLRILSIWREGNGPTAIMKALEAEKIKTTRQSVSLFIKRYAVLSLLTNKSIGVDLFLSGIERWQL